MLSVVEKASRFEADLSRGVVVIESDDTNFPMAIDELSSVEARNRAIGFAAVNGMGDPRINGNVVGPYAINNDGVPLEAVRDPVNPAVSLPPTHPKMQPARYRADVPVTRRLV